MIIAVCIQRLQTFFFKKIILSHLKMFNVEKKCNHHTMLLPLLAMQ